MAGMNDLASGMQAAFAACCCAILHVLFRESDMKVKTNVRAGSGKQNRGGGADNPPGTETPDPVVVPPISRCVGI
jgi:hypothetical protein